MSVEGQVLAILLCYGLVLQPEGEREEYRRLRRENAILRKEREILEKAAVFFARGQTGPDNRYQRLLCVVYDHHQTLP